MHNMKKASQQGQRRAARYVGDGWRGGSQVDRKATERVYAGGKGYRKSGLRMGLIVPIWTRK